MKFVRLKNKPSNPSTPRLDKKPPVEQPVSPSSGLSLKKTPTSPNIPVRPAFLRPVTTPKRNLTQYGWLIAIVLTLMAIAAYLMSHNRTPESTIASNNATDQVQKINQAQKPKQAQQPTLSQAQTATQAASSTNGTPVASVTTAETAVPVIPGINPNDILAAPLPQDPAIAKEEIDRLDEQHRQLAEQEAMMQEQLGMLHELSSKKQEQIDILEQKLRQLEAEKNGKSASSGVAN